MKSQMEYDIQETSGRSELPVNIMQAREKLGLSQTEVANLIGSDRAAISRYESGKREPCASTLRNLARALGTTSSRLLGEEEPAPEITIDLSVSAIPEESRDAAIRAAKAAAEAVLRSFMVSV